MKKILSIFVICAVAFLANAAGDSYSRISVLANGEILVDGETVSLEQIEPKLAELKANSGTVLYYRENPENESLHPNAMAVIKLVVEANLPISLSSEPDFSTVVLPDGSVERRE